MGVTPLKLLVTGANGFLGRHVVAAARTRGHTVRRLVRSGEGEVKCDLSKAGDRLLADALLGTDAVIHLAAAMSGDPDVQARDTLAGTRALLDAVTRARVRPHVVLASSIAVYSSDPKLSGQEITERSPIEAAPQARDAYVAAKLAQEAMLAEAGGGCVLRIGAIYGAGHSWNAHVGIGLGPVLLRIGDKGQIPLTYVKNAALAVVLAAEQGDGVINIVDSDLPDRRRFVAAHRGSGWPRVTLPVPFAAMERLGGLLSPWKTRPGLLHPPILRARMMPLRYSNACARDRLGWAPRGTFEENLWAALKAPAKAAP
ncbi:NAD-dependent epimerase/dehydratase family protein [Mesobacterium pallidum]|uniref:NAD-dependent epimerase/dehydratase family protein n=1 Tax=Mesobacterium pallidum TaxID=2872037 RepID=UPI001EE18731|nr:NAD-dependent epimerase/dehydratase family protein [Mesobacterium pallidum]